MVKTRNPYVEGCSKIKKQKKSHKPQIKRRSVKKYVHAVTNVTLQRDQRNRLGNLPLVRRVESSIGINYYNRNKYKPSSEKRMIIIDGSNVAYAYTNHIRFAPEGIDLAVRFVDKIGHETKVVVPDFRINEFSSENIMKRLKLDNKLILTPTKDLPTRKSSSYDDRFILQIAVEFDAAIISNDNYREFTNESVEFRKVIETRVIGYVFCKDMFMLPTDPYGSGGPTLQEILNRRL